MVEKLYKPVDRDNTQENLYREFRPYLNLSIAIIARACQDYAACNRGRSTERKEMYREHAKTFFHSRWFHHVDCKGLFDPEEIMIAIDDQRTNPRSFRVAFTKEGSKADGAL